MTEFLAHHVVLLLFVILGLGTAIGQIKIAKVAIGPAAVLFIALFFSSYDERLALPSIIGTFGLSIFAYTIGLIAGPSFFSSLKHGVGPVFAVAGVLTASGALAFGLGKLFGFSPALTAGLYAGSHTNTPGLAAAIERVSDPAEPTVAYSLTYAAGVLIMLLAAQWALKRGTVPSQSETNDEQITNVNILVTRKAPFAVREMGYTPHGSVVFSRMKSEDGELTVCPEDTVLHPGDTVLAVGPGAALHYVMKLLGEPTEQRLDEERQEVDFRRVVLSERQHFGRPVASLELWKKFGVKATRVRRADHDFLATSTFVVQAGDRIRLAGPSRQIRKAAKYLGDSEHGTSEINPVGLALGMAIGLLIGTIDILIPGLGTMTLGHAAGPLIAGLVLGRMQRTGPVVWSLPHQSADVLTHLGILLFLAYAGGRAGPAFISAVSSPLGWKVIAAGIILTTFHAVALVFICHKIVKAGGQRIGGYLSGSQTQPAVLAFANTATNNDQRVALAYALVFPVAMVAKITISQVLTLT